MAITRDDLVVFKPELLGTSDDAGGQRTKNPVRSGEINELFTAISDIDHAVSAVDIVKCFPALDTSGTETLLDGHIFVSQPPTDPLVSWLIAESDLLDDESRMTDMVDILQGSVVAGQLVRRGLIGLLAGQDSFPRSYLQSSYQFDGREYWANVTLTKGQIICISVEYEGNANANYPRFEHFCEVQETVTGAAVGNVYFQPAIPYDTPDSNLNINGESGCTKLRFTSQNDGIKFHGVSRLAAANDSSLIEVDNTTVDMLPKVSSVSYTSNNTISGDSGATASLATRRGVFTARHSGRSTYTISVNDMLYNEAWFTARGIIGAIPAGFRPYNSTIIGLADSPSQTVSITNPDAGTVLGETGSIGFEYYSTQDYAIYTSSSAFPANKQLVGGTVTGSVRFTTNTENPDATFTMDANGQCIDDLDSRVLGTINILTGDFTPGDEDYRGAFELVNYSGFVEDSTGTGPVGVYTTSFTLKTNSPILESFYLTVRTTNDVLVSGSSDTNGVITGTGVSGTIAGTIVTLSFTNPCVLSSLRYDIGELVDLTPPPELYGLNPLRIKNGGSVNIFNAWTPITIEHTNVQAVVNPTAGQTLNVRPSARFVDITDANGASLWTIDDANYSHDNTTGVVTINSNFTGFTAPFVLSDSIGEEALVTSVEGDYLQLASELSNEYPVGSIVASVQNLGNLQARVGAVRDMSAWNNNWDQDGTNATGSLNSVDYPIEVNNQDATNEDWVLIFTSATAFRCVGRRLGQIATGDTLNDFAPINPRTQAPYFVIRSGAFGGGWNTGEAIRFATYAASKPAMLIRSVASGHSQITTDRAVLAFRGNES